MAAVDDPRDEVTASPGAEQRIRHVLDLLGDARPMPLSSSVVVNRDELSAVLRAALDELPEEVRAARWLLKERDEYLEQARSDAKALVDEASRQVEQMVQRTEITRQAEIRARRIVDDAEAEARRHRRETEDWCEQRLAAFDETLAKVTDAVQSGRERLRALPRAVEGADDEVIDLTDRPEQATLIFDQDDLV